MHSPADMIAVAESVVGVSTCYPTPRRPEYGVFVQSLFDAMRARGIRLQVVAPSPWPRRWREGLSFLHASETDVLRPSYSNLPVHLSPGTSWGHRLAQSSLQRAVGRSILGLGEPPAWVYAHFLRSGLACLDVCERLNIPCIVGLGESSLDPVERSLGRDALRSGLHRFAGIAATSTENQRFCVDRYDVPESRVAFIPNGVDTSRFNRRDRQQCRSALGLPSDLPIVAFCGHFVERKGPLRVLEALESLSGVYGVFLGRGPQIPRGQRVLHAGPVAHDQVPTWLSACDVFVLPSLAEGMSNAILEALACGLPVVVSDRSFNRSFLDSGATALVDPLSISSIAGGIKRVLSDGALGVGMGQAARSLAERYSISNRVNSLLEFCSSVAESAAVVAC